MATNNPPKVASENTLRAHLLGLSDAVFIPNDTKDDTGVVLHIKLTEAMQAFTAAMETVIGHQIAGNRAANQLIDVQRERLAEMVSKTKEGESE